MFCGGREDGLGFVGVFMREIVYVYFFWYYINLVVFIDDYIGSIY